LRFTYISRRPFNTYLLSFVPCAQVKTLEQQSDVETVTDDDKDEGTKQVGTRVGTCWRGRLEGGWPLVGLPQGWVYWVRDVRVRGRVAVAAGADWS
jgi:hypothetical protein